MRTPEELAVLEEVTATAMVAVVAIQSAGMSPQDFPPEVRFALHALLSVVAPLTGAHEPAWTGAALKRVGQKLMAAGIRPGGAS